MRLCGRRRMPKGIYSRPSLQQRFWAKVKKTESCWLWSGSPGMDGYGKLKVGKKTVRAHRVAWELDKGPIPTGLSVLHKCDTPLCVNVAHLFLGTHLDNVFDMMQKERQPMGAKNGRAKLSESAVKAVRKLRKAGASLDELAARFQVSRWTIKAAARRVTWTFL